MRIILLYIQPFRLYSSFLLVRAGYPSRNVLVATFLSGHSSHASWMRRCTRRTLSRKPGRQGAAPQRGGGQGQGSYNTEEHL